MPRRRRSGPIRRRCAAATTVYLAGQIGLDPATMEIVAGVGPQIHRVFRNLQAVAQAAGGDLKDVVKLTVYLTDLGHFALVNETMAGYFTPPYPARAAVGVASLPRGALVEMDAILCIGYELKVRETRRTLRRSPRPLAQEHARQAREAGHREPVRPGPAPAAALRRRDARSTRSARRRPGEPVLVEGNVVETRSKYRPRRQLLCHIEDGSGVLTLRFFHFYPSQLKQLAAGARVRAFGEIRHGFFGPEMVHPRYRVLHGEAPVPQALTPVYPTTAGLRQDDAAAPDRERARRLRSRGHAARGVLETLGLPPFREAVLLLHNPPPQVPQQALAGAAPSGVAPDEVRRAAGAAALDALALPAAQARAARRRSRRAAGSRSALLARLPFKLTRAQNRALAEIRARSRAAAPDAAPAAGRRRQRQDDRRGAGGAAVRRERLSGGGHGAHRDPRRAALPQVPRTGSAAGRRRRVAVRRPEREGEAGGAGAVAAGETAVVVGTHALFQEGVRFQSSRWRSSTSSSASACTSASRCA